MSKRSELAKSLGLSDAKLVEMLRRTGGSKTLRTMLINEINKTHAHGRVSDEELCVPEPVATSFPEGTERAKMFEEGTVLVGE